jgi:hypothetical protein
MWRTSAVFVIPFAICIAPSSCVQSRKSWARSPGPREGPARKTFVAECVFTSVHAGAENRTAIHLRLFRELCQPDFFGFHRFFLVFVGFVRFLVHFGAVLGEGRKNLTPICTDGTDFKDEGRPRIARIVTDF